MEIQVAWQLASVVLLFATLLAAAVTDVLRRKVYNWTTLPALAFGLTLGYAAEGLGTFSLSQGGTGLLDHLAGSLLGFTVFFVAYWGGGVGGGDVKLMAAIGAITGFRFVIGAMFWSALVGAVMAVWILLWRGRLLAGLKRSLRYAVLLRRQGELNEGEEENPATLKIPYGVAISFGTFGCWFLMEYRG